MAVVKGIIRNGVLSFVPEIASLSLCIAHIGEELTEYKGRHVRRDFLYCCKLRMMRTFVCLRG